MVAIACFASDGNDTRLIYLLACNAAGLDLGLAPSSPLRIDLFGQAGIRGRSHLLIILQLVDHLLLFAKDEMERRGNMTLLRCGQ